MKRFILLISLLLILGLVGCQQPQKVDIAATTLPVYEFTARLCQGTDLTVTRLITENVSCLHDYSLKVEQMLAIESAGVVIVNGAGLEDFMEDALHGKTIVEASQGCALLEPHHDHGHHHEHDHAQDPHIWLSPIHARQMVQTIYDYLCTAYPQHQAVFQKNHTDLTAQLDALQRYGEETLSDLSCRQLITFHDGFGYLAESFDLAIVRAVEEDAGSEASARERIELISLVQEKQLPAVFTEKNGSVSAASVISAETGVPVYALDMAMSGDSYFDSMYHNINVLKEALQ